MIFEQQLANVNDCHSLLGSAVDHWRAGRVSDAYGEIRTLFRGPEVNRKQLRAIDWLFMSDVASACGLYDVAHIFDFHGLKYNPDDPMLGLMCAWDHAAKGRFFKCRKQLKQVKAGLPTELLPEAHAIDVYNYSIIGWRKSAEKAAKKMKDFRELSPLAWYILSRAYSYQSRWHESVEAGLKVIELCPQWTRARCTLNDALLAIGDVQQAESVVHFEEPGPYCGLDFSRAVSAEAAGDAERCKRQLDAMLKTWTVKNRLVRFCARQLALLHLRDSELEPAKELITRHRLGKLEAIELSEGSNALISVPRISQNFNHCVPTVASMVAGSQGVDIPPIELAKAMGTRNGTPMFRMVDHMKSLGFRAECVRVDTDVIERMLSQGIPLIGNLSGIYSSHVDVVCGFHSGLKLIHLRDPMHWFGYSIFYKHLQDHYRESGGLWALIAPDRIADVEIRAEDLDPEGQAYLDLHRACARGNREQAELAYAGIPDDHELAIVRDGCSVAVTITPGQFQKRSEERLERIPDQKPTASSLRLLMSQINEESADRIMEIARKQKDDLGEKFLDYIEVQCQMAKNQWPVAEKRLEDMCKESPGNEQLWSHLSTAKTQLGKLEEAETCLAHAIDISPESESLQNRALDLQGNNLTFAERRNRIVRLMENNSDRPELNYELARVLLDGGDGLEYENTVRTCMKFYPRDPFLYSELAGWYMMQGRSDLACQTMQQGRELIGEEELPVQFYEDGYQEPGLNEDEEPADDQHDVPEASTTDSPEKPQSRFDQLMEAIGDRLRKMEKTDFRKAVKLDEVCQLREMSNAGEMTWLNSVRFHSNLINLLLEDTSLSPDEQAKELEEFLPQDSLPGVPDRFADALFDMIRGQIQRPVAEVLVKWCDQHCKRIGQYASLKFNRAYFLELMGRNNDSEKELNEIVAKHPAYAPAYFRLGQISTDRRDYQKAMEYHTKCLEITPGNAGALDELIKLSGHLQTEQYVQWLKAREQLYPYSTRYVLETAMAIASIEEPQTGIEWVRRAKRLPKEDRKLLEARMLADSGRHDEALKLVRPIQASKRNEYLSQWIEIDCLVAKNQFDELKPRLEKLLESSPDDYDVIDQLARVYRELDPQKAVEFAGQKLKEGIAIPVLAYIYVADRQDWLPAVKNMVEQMDPSQKAMMVMTFNEVVSHPSFAKDYVNFLKWAANEFPELTNLRATYATRLNMQGKDKRAVDVAKKLLKEDPENPQWLNLVGICVQDLDPKESIRYLKKEFEITGSAETLCRMARGYQLMGDHAQAKSHYRRALKANPYDTLAITNLVFRYEVQDDDIFKKICDAIRLGYGQDDQYFHVIAVTVARKLNGVLPVEWFQGALDRYQTLLVEGAFLDEEPKLRKAILAFAVKNKLNDIAKQYGSFIDRFLIRWRWPQMAWVPELQG